MKAIVVRNVDVSATTYYEPYSGISAAFRAVIRAVNEDLEANPGALIASHQGDPRPVLKVRKNNRTQEVTLIYTTRDSR